jgi:hypothetical protein
MALLACGLKTGSRLVAEPDPAGRLADGKQLTTRIFPSHVNAGITSRPKLSITAPGSSTIE